MIQLSPDQIREIYYSWWYDSYPNTKPSSQTANNYAAFGTYLQNVILQTIPKS